MINKSMTRAAVVCFACFTVVSSLANAAAPVTPTKAVFVTAKEYEQNVMKSVGKLAESPTIPPLDIEHDLLKRLGLGYFVTDQTIEYVVSARDSYDSRVTATAPHRYVDALHLVESLLPYTYGRPTLEAYLYGEKAHVLELNKQYELAIQEYQAQSGVLVPVHIAVDKARLAAMLQAADLLREGGDKKRAEPLYLDILSYDWYDVGDSQAMQDLRSLYVRAGRGVIDIRRGNLQSLQITAFVPATMGDLGPYLDEAITQAGGTPPHRPEPATDIIVVRPHH